MTKDRTVAVAAGIVAAAAIAGAMIENVVNGPRVTTEERSARSGTVTRIVREPVFGKSVLLGVHAAGEITSGGVLTGGSAARDTRPDDRSCSTEYAADTRTSAVPGLDRAQYMTACEDNVADTAKRDPGR